MVGRAGAIRDSTTGAGQVAMYWPVGGSSMAAMFNMDFSEVRFSVARFSAARFTVAPGDAERSV